MDSAYRELRLDVGGALREVQLALSPVADGVAVGHIVLGAAEEEDLGVGVRSQVPANVLCVVLGLVDVVVDLHDPVLLLEREGARSRVQCHRRRQAQVVLHQGDVRDNRVRLVHVVQIVVVALVLHQVQHTLVAVVGLAVLSVLQVSEASRERSLHLGPLVGVE